jgi:hypothetical protein
LNDDIPVGTSFAFIGRGVVSDGLSGDTAGDTALASARPAGAGTVFR